MDVITFAIPVFFLLIGAELWVARRRRMPVYRFADAVTDLGCGVLQQASGLFLMFALSAPYIWIYERYRLFSLHEGAAGGAERVLAWVLGFLLVDLCYYAWHRASHRVNFIWATHVPHHQSEDYNLAVALRQAMLSAVTNVPFYLPLALIGISPYIFGTCIALNTVLQFWVHTELVGKLGPLEWVLNTPAHHRVHHAVNPRYLDRNYAGVFIIWDRLFWTFEEEKEPAVYGTVERFHSWNPLWANVEPWVKLAGLCGRCEGSDRLKVWFSPPEWRPAALGGAVVVPEVKPGDAPKWGGDTRPGLVAYVSLWFVAQAVVLVALLVAVPPGLVPMSEAPLGPMGLGVGMVLWGSVSFGMLFEGRVWALAAERVRLLVVAALGGIAVVLGWTAGGGLAVGLAVVSWLMITSGRVAGAPDQSGSASRM